MTPIGFKLPSWFWRLCGHWKLVFPTVCGWGGLSKSCLQSRQRHVCSTHLSAHAQVLCRIVEWLDFGWLAQATNKRSIPRSYETGLLFKIRDNQFWDRGWRADLIWCYIVTAIFYVSSLFDDMLHLLISHVFTGRCLLVGWIGRLPTVCEINSNLTFKDKSTENNSRISQGILLTVWRGSGMHCYERWRIW